MMGTVTPHLAALLIGSGVFVAAVIITLFGQWRGMAGPSVRIVRDGFATDGAGQLLKGQVLSMTSYAKAADKQITVAEYLSNSHIVHADSRQGVRTAIVDAKGKVVATVGGDKKEKGNKE